MNKTKTRIEQMFSAIVPRYDLMNRLLSGGMDKRWRSRLVKALELSPGNKVLDLCAGTGDVALEIVRQVPGVSVVALDFSSSMLEEGRKKAAQARAQEKIRFEVGDATALSFPDNSFDASAMAFGLRNVEDARKGIAEMARVLKPGGRGAILEFSRPSNSLLRLGSRLYIRIMVPLLGGLFSQKSAYQYLADSIEEFTQNVNVPKLMEQGFGQVQARPLMFGVVSLYTGKKR